MEEALTEREREEMQTGLIKIGKFYDLYKRGVIFPYKNNRGGKPIDVTRVNKYASGWDTASSGCVVVEKTDQGYMLRDFHNRAEAIRRGVSAGKINTDDELLIRVIPPGDGLSAYRRINAAVGHTKRDKFLNPDLCFGSEISKILMHTKAFDDMQVPGTFYSQIASAILDLKIKRRSEHAFTSNHTIARYVDSSKEDAPELILSQHNVKLITTAMNYWRSIYDSVVGELPTQTIPKPIEKVFKSPQFFGLVVFDQMFNRKMGDTAKAARSVIKNQRKLEELVPYLTRANTEVKLETSKAIIGMLG